MSAIQKGRVSGSRLAILMKTAEENLDRRVLIPVDRSCGGLWVRAVSPQATDIGTIRWPCDHRHDLNHSKTVDIESCLFGFFLNTGQHSKTVGCWCICQLYLPILPLYLPLELTCKKYTFALFFPPSLHTGFMFLHPFGNLLDSTYSLFVDTLILFKLKKKIQRQRKKEQQRDWSFLHWITPQIATKARAWLIWSWKPGTSSTCPVWVQESTHMAYPPLLSQAVGRKLDWK